ncbi:MAG: CRISPR-associated endonuclease Cas1 [Thermoprotei archaeon]|mgnify:FL=1|nr:MAG: CRISPR-associated endonuclease Cas1 [Thermoprotei archaeon]
MRTLIVSGYGVKIAVEKGVLKVVNGKEKLSVNLVDLEQIVIVTSGVSITSKAVRSIIYHGVDLVFLNHRGEPIGRVYPPYINRTVNTRRMQYLAYLNGKGAKIAKVTAECKLRNQAGLLRRFSRNTGDRELKVMAYEILKYVDEVRNLNGSLEKIRGEIVSIEAKAARIYWPMVAKLLPENIGFQGREQDGFDPFNIALNYGYGILYSESWKALVLAGLDPYAGFIHADRSGKPTLSFDFVEMFRCSIVDFVLLKMFRKRWKPRVENGILDYKSRAEIAKNIIEGFERKVRIQGEPLTLRQAMKRAAFNLASFIRGDSSLFKGFVEDW